MKQLVIIKSNGSYKQSLIYVHGSLVHTCQELDGLFGALLETINEFKLDGSYTLLEVPYDTDLTKFSNNISEVNTPLFTTIDIREARGTSDRVNPLELEVGTKIYCVNEDWDGCVTIVNNDRGLLNYISSEVKMFEGPYAVDITDLHIVLK